MAQHDLLQLGVGQGVEVEVPRQVAAQPAVRVLDRSLDLPPESGGVGSERHAATGVTIASMPALASIGVR